MGFYPPAIEAVKPGNPGRDAATTEPFTLVAADGSKDHTFQSRLDMETALLRRRYEIVISERCPRMKNLDGLPFRRSEVFRKDAVFDELGRLGLIKFATRESSPEHQMNADERTPELPALNKITTYEADDNDEKRNSGPQLG